MRPRDASATRWLPGGALGGRGCVADPSSALVDVGVETRYEVGIPFPRSPPFAPGKASLGLPSADGLEAVPHDSRPWWNERRPVAGLAGAFVKWEGGGGGENAVSSPCGQDAWYGVNRAAKYSRGPSASTRTPPYCRFSLVSTHECVVHSVPQTPLSLGVLCGLAVASRTVPCSRCEGREARVEYPGGVMRSSSLAVTPEGVRWLRSACQAEGFR